MTDHDALVQLRELEAKATPGPWLRIDKADYGEIHAQFRPTSPAVALVGKPDDIDAIVALRNDALRIIEQQAAEIAQLRDDAARYVWLRDHSCPPHNFYVSVPDEFHGVFYSPQEVDAYVDAARAALKGQP